jgi:hypothetical protein
MKKWRCIRHVYEPLQSLRFGVGTACIVAGARDLTGAPLCSPFEISPKTFTKAPHENCVFSTSSCHSWGCGHLDVFI